MENPLKRKADTTELENAVKSAEALVMEEYTQSSWAVLSLRLNDAKELLETAANETVEQQTVDKAVENLNLAVAQLEKKEVRSRGRSEDKIHRWNL